MDATQNRSFAYQEEQARQEESAIRMGDRPPIRMPAIIRNGGFHPLPMATLTPEQARAAGYELYDVLMDLHNVLAERGHVDDLVLHHVWGRARAAVSRASKIEITPEAVAASDSPSDSGESDAAAGDGEIHRSEGSGQPSPG